MVGPLPDIAELRLSDEDFQTLICSSYHFHEDEEFKIEYWGRAVEIASLIKGHVTVQARDMERLFSEHRSMQVKLPNLRAVFTVLVSREVLAHPPSSDWFSEASRGFVTSAVHFLKNWIRPAPISSFVVMPVVLPLVDKVLDKFDSEPFLFEDVMSLLNIGKSDANVVMSILLRKYPQAQAYELTCGTRRLQGIKVGGALREEEKALVMQRFAANELQRREDRLAERVIASENKARAAVRNKHPKELVLLELRVKRMLLAELEKLKVLSLQIQQSEHHLQESQTVNTVLDALQMATTVAKNNLDVDAAERIMSSKADMEDMQQELRDLLKCEDSDELAKEAEALMADVSNVDQTNKDSGPSEELSAARVENQASQPTEAPGPVAAAQDAVGASEGVVPMDVA